jgi:hypothetical protein
VEIGPDHKQEGVQPNENLPSAAYMMVEPEDDGDADQADELGTGAHEGERHPQAGGNCSQTVRPSGGCVGCSDQKCRHGEEAEEYNNA